MHANVGVGRDNCARTQFSLQYPGLLKEVGSLEFIWTQCKSGLMEDAGGGVPIVLGHGSVYCALKAQEVGSGMVQLDSM